MSIDTRTTVDCRGMRCPAPILEVSRASRKLNGSATTLEVLADDDGFPVDIKAWCRTTGADLASVESSEGIYTALIHLNGKPASAPATAEETAPTPIPAAKASAPKPAAPVAPAASTIEVDCRGMRCPAPIMAIAKAYKGLAGDFGVLTVRADDGDFPVDLRAWCRSTGSRLESLDETDGAHVAVVHVNPDKQLVLSAPTPAPVAPPAPAPVAAPEPVAAPAQAAPAMLDFTGEAPERLVLRLGAAWLDAGDSLTFRCDAGAAARLEAWAELVSVTLVDIEDHGQHLIVTARAGREPKAEPVAAVQPPAHVAAAQPPAHVAAPAVVDDSDLELPRRNATTLLILRNDFESLMAAMMVANSSAAQGMEVSVYFSFWGVNLLRADTPQKPADGAMVPKSSLMKSMMKWMMPKGPERQTMSKMHMGGMGIAMMKHFMRQQNVMSLTELMQQAVDIGVTFKVCTMSMGIMGIEKHELMDLPNIEFGGVTAFTAEARTSASSMVF